MQTDDLKPPPRLRILHIIASANLADGGPIEGAVRMGEVLAERGHRQDILSLDDPADPFLASVPGTVFAVGDRRARAREPFGRLRARLALTPQAAPWLRDHLALYDVAIVAGLWNYSTLVARRVLVGSPLPYVVFTHGMLDPWFKRTYPLKGALKRLVWLFGERHLLRHAYRVLFTCEEERRLARTSYRPYVAHEQVVGFGTADVDLDAREMQMTAFRASLPALGQRRFLLFLSRIHEKKGCDLLIEAFARATERIPDLDLVVAGPDQQGLMARLQERARVLGLEARIHWPGMLSGNRKWGAFHSCEAFILPSHQENFGVVLAEAMACSRPILTTNKVNIWREIDADGAGIVTDDTIDSVTAGLERFLRWAPKSGRRWARAAADRSCSAIGSIISSIVSSDSSAKPPAPVLHMRRRRRGQPRNRW